MARLDFDAEERESVLKLIRMHLEMSNALRRDIFDLENVRGFAEKIGSPIAAEDAHAADLRRHQGRQPRSADTLEGREPVAALHGHRQLHGPQRGRDSLSRRHRSHPAQPPAIDGARRASTRRWANSSKACRNAISRPAFPSTSAITFSSPPSSTKIRFSSICGPPASSSI